MKRTFYVETADCRYAITALRMLVDGDTVSFIDCVGGSTEPLTVLAIRGFLYCGVDGSQVIDSIHVKGKED